VDWLPVSGFGASIAFTPPAGAPPAAATTYAELRVVGADYFRTMRVPLMAGRTFDQRDVEGAPGAVAINEALARAYFGGTNPIGERLTLDRGGPLQVDIVGVVGDVREVALRLPAAPTIYAPKTQPPWIRHETRDLVVRSTADIATIAPAIQTVLRDLEPDMPRPTVQRMDDVIAGALTRPGFYAAALASFALTAVLLAGVGIYGTVSSAVAERRRELGVRLALGASRGNVLVRAARYGGLPTLLGLAAGVPLGFAAGRVLRQQLYGVEATDLATMVAVAAFMGAVAIVAGFVPALHASRIDPASVLRHEEGG
jgi:putative ABC transport system permease protein